EGKGEMPHEDSGVWELSAVPADLHGADAKDLVLRVLDSVCEDSVNYGSDQCPVDSVLRRVALVMARSAAITRGVRLSPDEMEHMVADLFSLPDPTFTPNGNRIYASLDESSLLRLLG
ncbi:MAG: hypothetical protein K2J05_03040, partial [Muribaculaceae bacterium]|nr:hypothetical protein [Muribaculaceae bacterium]